MDPALRELIAEGRADDDVAVVVRFHDKAKILPRDLKIVARFGSVATARTRRSGLARLHADPAIASLKAPRLYSAELHTVHEPEAGEADEPLASDTRRPEGQSETGRGTVIAVLDWSIDFAHPDFRKPDGKTRLMAIWDQRPRNTAVKPYGYGRVHNRAAIDRALASPDPFGTLGYTPSRAAHGTHVMGIAAGNGRAGGAAGVAPEAELIFVHLSGGGDGDLGSSIEILEGIDFAVRTAGDRPLVINMSLGRHAGPHDGTLLVERAIDALLVARPGLAVVQSAGNYFSRRVHMTGRLSEGRIARLPVQRTRTDGEAVQVEIWYKGADVLDARVTGPGGVGGQAAIGKDLALRQGATDVGHLYHRRNDPNNGDNLVNLVLRTTAPAGEWAIELEGIDVVDGRWHAWIERDAACPACQAQFPADLVSTAGTNGSICNAMRTVAVGAFDGHDAGKLIPPFSSAGPTRDGRRKPLLSAPGVRVIAPRSRDDASSDPGYVRMSGTSMAAPHVAGTIALMMEAAGTQRISTLRRTLFMALDRADGDEDRRGYGLLNIATAVESARALRRAGEAEPLTLPVPPALAGLIDQAAATALADPVAALQRALDPADPSMAVIGWPGRPLTDMLRAGDLLLRQGIGTASRLMTIADPAMLSAHQLSARGMLTEHTLPGHFVGIAGDDGTAAIGRRVTGPNGLVSAETFVLRAGEAGESPPPPVRRTIRNGSSGPAVGEAQTLLNRIDARRGAEGASRIVNCPLAVDGRFGPRTRGAVVSFQRVAFPGQTNEWDGVVGRKTWAMLELHARGHGPVIPPKIPPRIDPPNIIPIMASGVIPVIVLPGVMGTRLRFPDGSGLPRWDPDSNSEMFEWFNVDAATKLRSMSMFAPATILADSADADEHRRGWDQVAQGFYRTLFVAIEQAFNTPPPIVIPGVPQLRCPVWVMGYDWRQGNARHVSALDAFIDRVLESERGSQRVIIVTHSMGGLVARAALAALGDRFTRRVKGVIHTVQPATGAVVAARRFRTGFSKAIDGPLGEAMIAIAGGALESADQFATPDEDAEGIRKFAQTMLFQALFSDRRFGPSPIFYNRLMAVLAGPNELLPSDAGGRGWWPFAQGRPESLFDLYGMPGGLIEPSLALDAAGISLQARFSEAKIFHKSIEQRYHPVTGVLFATGLTTDTSLDPQGRPKEGDGTVPAFSARCPDLKKPHFRHGFAKVEHGACFGSTCFLEAVLDGIAYIAAGAPPVRERRPPPRAGFTVPV